MELLQMLLTSIKYFIIVVIAFVIYTLYTFIWVPIFLRRKYSKYPNVAMSESFRPFLGEHAVVKQMESENKYRMYFQMETTLKNPKADVRLTISGKQPYFMLTSSQAVSEFKSLVLDKIDRWDYTKKNFGRMSIGSLDQRRSDKEWKKRRDSIMRTIGINFASKYIPMMIQKVQQYSKDWKEDQYVDFDKCTKGITFEIITDILFGKEILHKIGMIPYKQQDDTIVNKDLQDFFMTLTRDCFSAPTKIHCVMFPFLIHNNWLKPNNVIYQNIQTLWKVLREFLDGNEEQDIHKSVYAQVLEKDNSFDRDLLMKGN